MKNAKRVFSFYLLPNFSLRALSAALEVLKLANEIVGTETYQWRIVSSDGEAVTSNSDILVAVDGSLNDENDCLGKHRSPKMAVVCGGNDVPDGIRPLAAWLRECRKHRVEIAAFASGSFVLARYGFADGRRCAVHWEQYPRFSEEFPDVVSVQTAFEIDGDLHTCPGGDVPFDLFLRFVERDCGGLVMRKVWERGLANRLREMGERQRLPVQARHVALIRVIEQMEENVTEPLPLSILAKKNRLSRRQLERLFVQQVGRTPARYYMNLRLERAHLLLLSSPIPIIQVAVACGFVSSSHFSKTYRETYGCSPIQTRTTVLEQHKRQYGTMAFREPRSRSYLPKRTRSHQAFLTS